MAAPVTEDEDEDPVAVAVAKETVDVEEGEETGSLA